MDSEEDIVIAVAVLNLIKRKRKKKKSQKLSDKKIYLNKTTVNL